MDSGRFHSISVNKTCIKVWSWEAGSRECSTRWEEKPPIGWNKFPYPVVPEGDSFLTFTDTDLMVMPSGEVGFRPKCDFYSSERTPSRHFRCSVRINRKNKQKLRKKKNTHPWRVLILTGQSGINSKKKKKRGKKGK